MAWDFSDFDLSLWKVTLPVDEDYFRGDDGDGDPTDDKAFEVKAVPDDDDRFSLEGFEAEEFFYYDEDQQAMIFTADVDGALTSSNTSYTRSELREMTADGDRAAWTVDQGGVLSATLKVTELATDYGSGESAVSRLIVGQIHGEDDELTRLYYNSEGELYYANELTGSDDEERLFYFENADGEAPNVALGETFSYVIEVKDGALNVAVSAGGEVYFATETDGVDPTEITDAWSDDTFYFKAGAYQGVTWKSDHPHEGEGESTAAFFALDVGHEDGEGYDAWLGEETFDNPDTDPPVIDPPVIDPPVIDPPVIDPPEVDPPTEEPPEVDPPEVDPPEVEPPVSTNGPINGTSSDDELRGTDDDDLIRGRSGNDDIKGDDGDDRVYGGNGADEIRGEDGDDDLRGNRGNDTIKGGDGNDIVGGGNGDDELWGGNGDDDLRAWRGTDWLKGGDGADIFTFFHMDGVDTIADFRSDDGDKINIAGILDDGEEEVTEDNVLEDGFVQLVQDGDITSLFVDLDGTVGNGDRVHVMNLEDQDADDINSSDFLF